MTNEELLLTIPVKYGTEIRMIRKLWMQNDFLDIREFYLAKDGTMRPNRKGIIFKTATWKEVSAIVDSLIVEAEPTNEDFEKVDVLTQQGDRTVWFPAIL